MKKITTILLIILVLALIILLAFWLSKRTVTDAPGDTQTITQTSITEQVITEENFTGTRPVLSGSSTAVVAANRYLDETIAAFRAQANQDVPDLRKQFGNDAPPSHYTLDFKAKIVTGENTQSIVIDGYRYTGGANGMSFYAVFTVNTTTNKLLGLTDIVSTDRQGAFTEYVKKAILAKQEGIFPESVTALTFESFKNFSFTDDSLIIYFDKYEIGIGALGAVAFSLPLSDIGEFITV